MHLRRSSLFSSYLSQHTYHDTLKPLRHPRPMRVRRAHVSLSGTLHSTTAKCSLNNSRWPGADSLQRQQSSSAYRTCDRAKTRKRNSQVRLAYSSGHKSSVANTVRTGQNSAARLGSSCTRPSLDSLRSPQTKRKKRCDNTFTCSSDYTRAENAQNTSARSLRSTHRRSRRRRLQHSGAASYTMSLTRG